MTRTPPALQLSPSLARRAASAAAQVPCVGVLFDHDWDALGFFRSRTTHRLESAGFDLFQFPQNARLIGLDLDRWAARLARRARAQGWSGVVSHNEQFGALLAALVAERAGLPGTAPEAVLAVQHKLYARRVLQQVAPEANLDHAPLDAEYGGPLPDSVPLPAYVKPVKAAFSVLAREVRTRDELQAHTRFGWREAWVIRHLVEPFDRVCRARLPQAGSAHRMMLEEPVPAATPQFNLDGWVHEGQVHLLGVVDALMYPGTQAFMRWQVPSRLPRAVQERALDVARRFLGAIGFTHGFFNMEFFFEAADSRLSVIEFNPRLASQFSDLYQRTTGQDPHAMSLHLACGLDPLDLPTTEPAAGAAASLVYRTFPGEAMPGLPSPGAQAEFARHFPDSLLFTYPRTAHGLQRDFKWLGSWRHGIVHLEGHDEADLRERAERASTLLGWTPPYAECQPWRGTATTPSPRSALPERPIDLTEPGVFP